MLVRRLLARASAAGRPRIDAPCVSPHPEGTARHGLPPHSRCRGRSMRRAARLARATGYTARTRRRRSPWPSAGRAGGGGLGGSGRRNRGRRAWDKKKRSKRREPPVDLLVAACGSILAGSDCGRRNPLNQAVQVLGSAVVKPIVDQAFSLLEVMDSEPIGAVLNWFDPERSERVWVQLRILLSVRRPVNPRPLRRKEDVVQRVLFASRS